MSHGCLETQNVLIDLSLVDKREVESLVIKSVFIKFSLHAVQQKKANDKIFGSYQKKSLKSFTCLMNGVHFPINAPVKNIFHNFS